MQAPSLLRPRQWDRITARTHCGNVSPNMGRPLFDSAIGGAFPGEEVLTPPAIISGPGSGRMSADGLRERTRGTIRTAGSFCARVGWHWPLARRRPFGRADYLGPGHDSCLVIHHETEVTVRADHGIEDVVCPRTGDSEAP